MNVKYNIGNMKTANIEMKNTLFSFNPRNLMMPLVITSMPVIMSAFDVMMLNSSIETKSRSRRKKIPSVNDIRPESHNPIP
jgi:hypothetical protein